MLALEIFIFAFLIASAVIAVVCLKTNKKELRLPSVIIIIDVAIILFGWFYWN